VSWFLRGLFGGIRTTHYPKKPESTPGTTPGLPVGVESATLEQHELAAICPTSAIENVADRVEIRAERCVHCMRCAPGVAPAPLPWRRDSEWATSVDRLIEESGLGSEFRKSIHVRVLDAGDCGACLSEVTHLNDPLYNMHRLGIFITPTPRQADVLLIVGPVTEQMRGPLLEAYEAMPEPKRVVAVGACAASGGVFGPSFTSAAGALDVVPVDVVVPGCPPPPLAVLDALLVLAGRGLNIHRSG
jgi:Ni,Fe-hydrogenase III small subunit